LTTAKCFHRFSCPTTSGLRDGIVFICLKIAQKNDAIFIQSLRTKAARTQKQGARLWAKIMKFNAGQAHFLHPRAKGPTGENFLSTTAFWVREKSAPRDRSPTGMAVKNPACDCPRFSGWRNFA
jgi:hypothetical protein